MKILSLFDGVSCARLALEKNNIRIELYCSSEIDKYAIKVTQANRPDTVPLGDISQLSGKTGQFDLLIGGVPCQSWSIAGRRAGFDERGNLWLDFARLLKEVQPKQFIAENVMGLLSHDKGKSFETICEWLCTSGYCIDIITINATLVSAQNRNRVFILGKRQDLC